MEYLLKKISRCKHIEKCITNNDHQHPCYKIVQSQNESDLTQFQVPEPWSGRIEKSKILFISSNPSIGSNDHFPVSSASDEYLIEYFSSRFDGKTNSWTRNGTHELGSNNEYTNVAFWSAIKNRAKEILGKNVVPGEDYTLTEVVHCKSRDEVGVAEASKFCSDEYLDDILLISPASVIVVIGSPAALLIRAKLYEPNDENLIGPLELAGTHRMVAFLPHPNAWEQKTFANVLSSTELDKLREFAES